LIVLDSLACGGGILLSWLRHLALDRKLAKAEPKTLRYRIFHTAGRLVRGGRRKTLKIEATWPWATAIITAWKPIQALPLPSLVTPLTMAAQTGIGIPRAFPPACSAWS
jgi:hypothetical protein